MLSFLFIKVLEMFKAFFLFLYSEGTYDVYDVTERRTDCDNLEIRFCIPIMTRKIYLQSVLIPKVGTELHNNNYIHNQGNMDSNTIINTQIWQLGLPIPLSLACVSAWKGGEPNKWILHNTRQMSKYFRIAYRWHLQLQAINS